MMAADNLRMQVILSAMDKATAPFRKIQRGGKGLADQLLQSRDALRKLNATQRDLGAFRQQVAASRESATAYAAQQAKVRGLAAAVAAATQPSRALTKQFKDATRVAGLMKDKQQQQAAELQRLRSGLDRAGISTRNLGNDERRLRADIARTNESIKRQETRLAAANRMKERAAKLQSAGIGMVGTGAGLAFGGQRALMAGALPLSEAMSFESAMADVRKVVDFDTPEQFKEMGRDVQNLSTKLPMVSTDIAKIVAAAGQAGIAKAELVRFAEDAAKMGVAFDTTAEDAGQTMATWRTAFRMGQDDVVVLADKINYLGNTGPASVQKISEVVNRIGALGEVAGLGSGPLAALGATVAGMGIESEVSATGIKNMLLTLSSGEAATSRQVAAFSKLGINATDMAQAMQKDAGGAILSVLDKLKLLPKHEQAATMTTLFGRESIGAIAPLLTNLDLLKTNFDKVTDATQYSGSMSAEYASRVATSENALQLLKNTVNVTGQAIGETLMSDFKALAEQTAEVVKTVIDWIRENPELVKMLAKAAIVGAALVTVFGALMVTAGVVAMSFSQISAAMALLSSGGGMGGLVTRLTSLAGRAFPMLLNVGRMLLPLLGGISLPVLAIGAAVAVVAALVWKYWEPIKAFMIGVWEGILDVVNPIMDELMTALEPLGPVWDMISNAMSQAWDWVKKLFEPFEATSEQLQGATDAGRGFGQILGNVLTVNLRLAVKAIGWLVDAFTTILPIIKNAIGGAWKYLQGAWDLIVGLFTLDGDLIRNGLSSMWDGINQILVGWPAKMLQSGKDMISGLIDGIRSMAGSVGDIVSNIGSGAVSAFKSVLGIHSPSRVFKQLGDYTMQGLAGGLDGGQDRAVQSVVGLGDRMKRAGAGMVLAAAVTPVVPVSSAPVMAPSAGGAGMAQAGGNTYHITIQAGAGADAQAIAQAVRAELDRRDREAGSRHNARLTD
ncbi:TPA: phage tail tape measure protein [Stenotrophomonas maltophilia]|nr:phage tail tape measure protein [Stenotrophomonas maltophilia]HEL7675747.1 phage tail tape measure protein [Stenotrophomonas maltophilia]